MSEQKGSMIVPIAIIAGLFAIFGFVTWINGALIPFMQSICELTSAEAFLVASASYISFSVMALPSAYVLKKTGYKNGMSIGLLLMAIGAVVFIPAASSRTFSLVLVGIFIQGSGMTLLQTAANPYITIIGPIESAAKRISIMGICNKSAGALGSFVFGALLLSGIDELKATVDTISLEEKEQFLNAMASSVNMPYTIMALALGLFAVLIRFAPLPDIEASADEEVAEGQVAKTSVFQFPHLLLGVLTLFIYVGAEVIAGDTIIAYGISLGLSVADAKYFTSFTLGAMIVTYLMGVVLIPKYISQETALKGSAVLGLIFSVCIINTTGFTSVLFVASLGIANALVWPAIWPLALNGLGKFTKTGSALLIMGISGGAIIPPLYGLLVDMKQASLIAEGIAEAEATSTAATGSYWLLLPCYVMILYYAFAGHKIGFKKN
ncbi:glucose/galactose transporter [Reichenbachiella faecimaris]|uniref:Glucose/galactose transporter n=1 Tax=Reichenbachiella faecimaris TaxID=692418 RepID=A0A1W2G7W7_REIFA|nr:sugar MFS transporter [Reichenbachiella faecimaris]SMD32733.1 glucose/galactose transporter [Reichenbachiella faecimaris]